MESTLPKRPLRVYTIDLLRFVAAFSVVLYHYTFRGYYADNLSPVAYPALESVCKYGYLGVNLFFMISGYVILMSAYKKSLRQFFVSRITRLYPAYWVACTLTFLIVWFFAPAKNSADWSYYYNVSIPRYVVNLTMLQSFVGAANVDGVYWTLGVELSFYFLISLLIFYKLFDYLMPTLVGWLAITVVIGPASTSHLIVLLFPKYSPFFMAGMLFYLLHTQYTTPWKLYTLLGISFLLAARSIIYESGEYSQHFRQDFSPLVGLALLLSFYVVFWLIARGRLTLASYTWLATAGALTYPLYLLHHNIGFILLYRLGGSLNRYLLLVLLIGFMLFGAYLIHALVEKRLSQTLGQQLGKRFNAIGRVKHV
ncbi:acyltransferase family protein [Spirosoma lituiforme]